MKRTLVLSTLVVSVGFLGISRGAFDDAKTVFSDQHFVTKAAASGMA